ncbi:MAG: DUF1064 domain-containing protein [Acutalibacteraceae bacterium]
MNKYHAQKTILDGIKFDSKRESERYAELKLLQRSGQIRNIRRQVPFELVPKQDGERSVKYIADFVYEENGRMVVEDAKGFRPKDYIIKRKLMLWIHGIKVREV